jgi:hypothetical protein
MPITREVDNALKNAAELQSLNTNTQEKTKGGKRAGKVKFINMRMPESLYQQIGHCAVSADLSRADFCRTLASWGCEMIDAGALKITAGGVIDMRIK